MEVTPSVSANSKVNISAVVQHCAKGKNYHPSLFSDISAEQSSEKENIHVLQTHTSSVCLLKEKVELVQTKQTNEGRNSVYSNQPQFQ